LIRGEEPSLRSSQIANPDQIKIGRPKGRPIFIWWRGEEPSLRSSQILQVD
jgi:hypothetical protein